MFRSRKTNTAPAAIGAIKDWRDAGHEIEHLGQRLDAAMDALKECKTPWARDFWATTVARLFTKWTLMVKLRDTGLRQQGPASFYNDIDYYWWEKSEEIRMASLAIFENLLHDANLSSKLDESWAKSKEEKLEKARLGLA
jgi:hypothetical protein